MGLTLPAATVIGGGLSALGSIFGSSSSNSSNLRATRETNEMNYKIWQEQLQAERAAAQQQWEWQNEFYQTQKADNIEFWNMQNRYNDPSAQRDRWEAAGFSPWALAGNGNAGVATSAPASPSGTTAPRAGTGQAPTMQAYYQQTSPIVVGIQAAAESLVNFAQAYDIMNKTNPGKDNIISGTDKNNADAAKSRSETSLNNQSYSYNEYVNPYRKEMTRLEYEYQADTQLARIKHQRQLANYQEALTTFQGLKNDEQAIMNKYLDARQFVQYNIELQNLSNLVLDGKLKVWEAKEKAANILLTYAKTALTEQQTKTEEQATRIASAQGDIAENEAFVSNTEHDALKYRTHDIKKAASDALDVNLQRLLHDSLQLDNSIVPLSTENKERRHWFHGPAWQFLDYVDALSSRVGKVFGGSTYSPRSSTHSHYGNTYNNINN